MDAARSLICSYSTPAGPYRVANDRVCWQFDVHFIAPKRNQLPNQKTTLVAAELEPRKLAGDMAGIDPAFLGFYKRLIDDGYAASFGEGLKLEAQRSSAANSAVAPEEVEARRAAVQERGRGQG